MTAVITRVRSTVLSFFAKNCSGVPSKRPQSSGLWPGAGFAGAPASRSSEGMLSIARGRPVSEGDPERTLRRSLV